MNVHSRGGANPKVTRTHSKALASTVRINKMHLFGYVGERPKVSYRDAIERRHDALPAEPDDDDEPE